MGINQNFWAIFLILAMLSTKSYRTSGIMLLAIQAIFGFIQWAFIAVMIFSLLGAIINDTKRKD